MTDKKSFKQRWDDFRPSKTQWFWSSVGVAVAVIAVGFTAGGWVTGGSADEMVETAAADARADVVASICVENFALSEDAAAQLASIKDASSWDRDDIVEEGGWARLAGMEEAPDDAVDLCGDRLAEFTLPEEQKAGAGEAPKG